MDFDDFILNFRAVSEDSFKKKDRKFKVGRIEELLFLSVSRSEDTLSEDIIESAEKSGYTVTQQQAVRAARSLAYGSLIAKGSEQKLRDLIHDALKENNVKFIY